MNALNAEPTRQDIVKALLEETNTQGPPTDEEIFAKDLGLEIIFFDEHTKYQLSKRVKAFLLVDKGVIGVFSGLTPVQQRFSIFHEIGHLVLPGHTSHPNLIKDSSEGKIISDDLFTLSNSKSIVIQEIEANQFAADCIFQLDNFDRYIAHRDVNWLNIRLAADTYDASIESTARRWIECVNEPYALVAFNPVDRTTPLTPLEIMYTITSHSFGAKYFSGLQKGQQITSESLIFRLYHRQDMYLGDEPEGTLSVNMRDGSIIRFKMLLFSNSYRVFGILTPIE